MNRIRLTLQHILSAIAIPLRFNDRLIQFCDRCGRSRYLGFWADNEVWEAVAGNVNGHRHGAYCIECFNSLASERGILLQWKPEICNE